jgi:lipopolysaccharide export LptBFGC system permease protein LptF
MAKEGRLFLDEAGARMYFILTNGAMQVFNPAARKNPSELVRFEGTATVDVDIADVLKKKGKTLADLTMNELNNALAMMPPHVDSATAGLTDTAYPQHKVETEWHKRTSSSLVPLLFVILAVPLGVLTRATSRLVGLGMGCLPVLVFYYPLNTLAETLALGRTLPVAVALWTPTVLLLLVGAVLFAKVQ